MNESIHSNISDVNLIDTLVAHNDGSTFLPALQSLHWIQNSFAGETLIKLSCPSLTMLKMECVSLDEVSTNFLALLPPSFPSLRTLDLGCNLRPFSSTPSLLRPIIPTFQNLRILRVVDWLNWEDLNSIISPLEELKFCAAGPDGTNDIRGALHAPNLRILTCYGYFSPMRPIISSLVAPKLEVVTFESTGEYPNHDPLYHDVTGVLDALITSQPPVHIRNITLEFPGVPTDSDLDTELIEHVLYPCLKLPRLEKLTVWNAAITVVYCSDEGILSLAQSLKHLVHLDLSASPRASASRSVSLASLVHLSVHCPHLAFVRLLLGTLLPAAPAALPALPPPGHSHPLETLDIMHAPGLSRAVEDPAVVAESARVLLRLFPTLNIAKSRMESRTWIGDDAVTLPSDRLWDEVGLVKQQSNSD